MTALNKIFWIACLSIVVACGKSSETTNGVPAPTNPTIQNPVPDYTVPDTTPDPRIPDLTTAVAIRLPNPSDYSGLEELAKILYLPLVGDPKVSLQIKGDDRETSVTGSVLVAFEDRAGFWAARLNSFEGTGVRTSSALDMIFADDELVVRVVGGISGDNLDGAIHYRIRQDGDTGCRKVQTCSYNWSGYYSCVPQDPAITASNCRSYMQLGTAPVKQLGSFHTKYSSWVVR